MSCCSAIWPLKHTKKSNFSVLFVVLSAWAHVEAAKATPPVERIAGSCLNAGSKVTIKCPSANQNIDIISVAYAHTPNGDCNNPLADNDCQGPR